MLPRLSQQYAWLLPACCTFIFWKMLNFVGFPHGEAMWLWICFCFIAYLNTKIHTLWLNKNADAFVLLHIGSIAIRAIISLACYAGFLLAGIDKTQIFTVYFLVFYLSFMISEVADMWVRLQHNS